MPGPDEYDHNSKESAMHVLEVRNDELMDSITRQAALLTGGASTTRESRFPNRSPPAAVRARRESADPDRDAVGCPSLSARNEDSAPGAAVFTGP